MYFVGSYDSRCQLNDDVTINHFFSVELISIFFESEDVHNELATIDIFHFCTLAACCHQAWQHHNSDTQRERGAIQGVTLAITEVQTHFN